ncbi:MAG: hypothetical protein ACRDJH_24375 [Thermomicrobiales bacterium]
MNVAAQTAGEARFAANRRRLDIQEEIQKMELDSEINDPAFAWALADRLRAMLSRGNAE